MKKIVHSNGESKQSRYTSFFYPVIQPKLTISQPNDVYEQEADAMADKVMRMTDNESIRQSFFKPAVSFIQRKCEHCEEEEKKMQRKEMNGEEKTADYGFESYVDNLNSSGQSLPNEVRNFYEPRLGYDFSNVKVHTDGVAAKSAQSINALAYTSENNIVFNSGQYSPQTDNGKRLLGHELTHVVQQNAATANNRSVPTLQRQGGSGTPATPENSIVEDLYLLHSSGSGTPATPAKSYPYSVTFTECDKAPYNKATVEAAVKTAFETVRDSNCIKNESLKEDVLAKFNGLNIDCEQGQDNPCGMALRYLTQTVNIYPPALNLARCGLLESTILHEIIHLTEWSFFPHGDLAGGCEAACFPAGGSGGDPSKCTVETGFIPVVGASGGVALSEKGTPTKYARLYFGVEKRGPVLSYVHPSLGIGVGLIGEATTGEPGAIPVGQSTLISLLGGLRVDPGEPGGGYISFSGGPTLALRDGKKGIGIEAGTSLGYRWRWLDISADAGYNYDPTRQAGMDKFFTLGASIKISTSIGQ